MMKFTESVKICFKKYFVTSGRATRAEYWWFQLFWWAFAIFCAIMATIAENIIGKEGPDYILAIWALFFLFTLIPNFCVCTRRLHDTGWSRLTFLWCFLGFWLGLLIINIRNMFPSDDDNEYGKNPFSIKDIEDLETANTNVANTEIEDEKEEKNETNLEDETRFMPQSTVYVESKEFERNDVEKINSQATNYDSDAQIVSNEEMCNDVSTVESETHQHINFCRHCGASVNNKDAVFCKVCGKRL